MHRKTLDIISVFRNAINSQKIYKLVMKNQRVFDMYEKEFFYNNKQINNCDRVGNNNNS